MDNLVFSYNSSYRQNIIVNGVRSKNCRIEFNKDLESTRFAFASTTLAEPCIIDISDNIITDAKTTAGPVISYIRNSGTDISQPNIARIDRNIISIDVAGLTNTTQAMIGPIVDNNSPDVRVFIRDNKIKFTGNSGLPISPLNHVTGIRLWDQIWQSVVKGNEIEFSATNYDLIHKHGILIFHSWTTIQRPGTLYDIANNKINGFVNSVAVVNATSSELGTLPTGVIANINNNSFTGDSISINNGDISETVNANCNWYGTAEAQDILQKVTVATVNYTPWLTNGTDNDPVTGFQPLPGNCNGTATVLTFNSSTNVSCFEGKSFALLEWRSPVGLPAA
jgi:hypothetical protein